MALTVISTVHQFAQGDMDLCTYVRSSQMYICLSSHYIWIIHRTPSKLWDEIIKLFQNFKGYAVVVYEWIINYTQHFTMDAITYYYLFMLQFILIRISKIGPCGLCAQGNMGIWVRSRNCGCLFTWFCYQLIAKPGNKTVLEMGLQGSHFMNIWQTSQQDCMRF